MATEKWVNGATVGWSSALNSTEMDSLAAGNAVLISTQIDNSSNLDMFADVEIDLGTLNLSGTPFIGVYIYPLNSDNTHYGDGRFTSAAAGPPPAHYACGSIGFNPNNTTQYGTLTGIVIPTGKFKFCIYNQTITLNGSGNNSFKWRSYNRQVA
jgi:hypothetical protein